MTSSNINNNIWAYDNYNKLMNDLPRSETDSDLDRRV